MNKRATLLLACLTLSLCALAQDPVSMLRFSRLQPYGSARSTAMGGAFGALGGDLSAIHVNPGGLGVFRNSEFSITPYIDLDRTKSVDKAKRNAFLLGDIGIVFNYPTWSGGWKGLNFAFGYVNMNNFNRDIRQYGGLNNTSIATVWCAQATGFDRSELGDELDRAFNVVLIDTVPAFPTDYQTQLYKTDRIEQERIITERGYQGEYTLAVGANFSDKFYLGAALGSQYLTYEYRSDYREYVQSDSSILDNMRRRSTFESSGSGINFKVGAIYRPIPTLRFGLAIHTPTFYTLSAYGEDALYASYNAPPLDDSPATRYESSSKPYDYDYELRTPWRFIASAAVVLQKRLIISADYEFVDYPSADLEDTFHGEYDWVREFFKYNTRVAHNLRAGAEYRANSTLSLRGGYSYSGSPYAKGDWNQKNHVQTLSAGLGFNIGNCHLDLAYLHRASTDIDYFYNYTSPRGEFFSSNKIETTLRDHEVRCTFGVKF
jgi:hypothetical protein